MNVDALLSPRLGLTCPQLRSPINRRELLSRKYPWDRGRMESPIQSQAKVALLQLPISWANSGGFGFCPGAATSGPGSGKMASQYSFGLGRGGEELDK